jgi:hypothetical protein
MQEQEGTKSQEGSENKPTDRRGKPIENPPSNVSPRTDPPPTPPPVYGGPEGGGDNRGKH